MMDIKMEEGTSSSPMQQDGLIVTTSSSSSSIQKIPSPSNNNANRLTLTKIQSSMSKRQQAAHKARMEALSFQLKTRLQYAMFKVEHGWSKQSLSEVENLYYKHRRASGSGLGGSNTKRSSPQTQRSGSGSQQQQQKHLFLPSTPTPQSRTTSPIAIRKQSMSNNNNSTTEAFGGLVTPPPSGGTLPINHERYKDLFSTSTGGNHSFSSGLTNQQSPSIHNTKINNNGQSQNSSSTTKTGKSYADFWSKIGSTNNNNNGNQTENNRSSS